jgi:hypothetical protein
MYLVTSSRTRYYFTLKLALTAIIRGTFDSGFICCASSGSGNGDTIMATFFCERCHKETSFLPIRKAVRMAAICRATIYNWMNHGWIHWSELPSGRRVICQESLLVHQAVAELSPRGQSIGR